MTDNVQLPSDQALVVQARGGSQAAWSELRARHIETIEVLARSRGHRQAPRAAEAAVERWRRELTEHVASEGSATPVDTAVEDQSEATQPPVRVRLIAALTGGSYGPAWSPPIATTPEPEAAPGPPDRVDATGRGDSWTRRELLDVAAAFAALPTAWQTVLWHRWVEHAPAAELTAILGRSPADVVALEQTAQRGLVDGYAAVVLAGDPPPDPPCRAVIALLGAHRRGALPSTQRRAVDAHLAGSDTATGCDACRRRLDLLGRLPVIVPLAIVPGLTGLEIERYRSIVGAGALAMGAAALAARRAERARRRARVAAGAAVVLALLAVAFFVREPFGDLDSEIADLLERVTTTTVDPSTTDSTVPSGSEPSPNELPNRIELVFPGAPQGAVYVPGGRALNLGITLSTPAPVYSGATGTIDVAITNNDTEDASVRFQVRSSPGVAFVRLSDGIGSCFAEQDDGARCTLSLPAGTTGLMSLQFTLDREVPDRLVVVPSIRSTVLEVPVETVPDLLVGQVGRGELRTPGATLGACDESPSCPNGRRDASTAALDLPPGAEIDRALLVWEGERANAAWADAVGLIPAGSSSALTVTAGNVPSPSGTFTTQSGQGGGDTQATGFRSVADVTDLVRAAGGGDYTVVRAPSVDEVGDGSWTLTVVTTDPASPRRLFVVVRPAQAITPDAPLRLQVPVQGSSPPRSPQRPLDLVLQAGPSGSAATRVAVNGATVSDDAFAGSGSSGRAVLYDWEIASTEELLTLDVATSAESLRLASVGLAADIVP